MGKKVTTINIGENRLIIIDKLVASGIFTSRSEFIRKSVDIGLLKALNYEAVINEIIGENNGIIIDEFKDNSTIEIEGRVYQIPVWK